MEIFIWARGTGDFVMHPFDNYVTIHGSLALMYCEPITLRNSLDQKVCVT